MRAEFESSLLVVLTVNVLYMYYVDHKLIILFIRVSQVVRVRSVRSTVFRHSPFTRSL